MWLRLFIAVLLGLNLFSAHAAELSDDELETQLAKSLEALRDNKLNIALAKIDEIIQENPNFKLAQLVKGDLLMTYSGAMQGFGSVKNAPKEQVEDLRAEAQARLIRVMEKGKAQQYIPRYLWALNDKQKYILVADTTKSTLYVYQNVNGEPRYVTDYYLTIGKLGADKSVEGDQRTPLGVYYITSFLSKDKLNEMYGKSMADIYGHGAFPLNYPNEWDQHNGKTGQGIWIHGTPSDTYSRPPRASNGCLVVSNENFDKISPYIDIGTTPIIVSENIEWATQQDLNDRQNFLTTMERWRQDWASLNTDAYLRHYTTSFFSEQGNYKQWIQQKRQVNQGKEWVKIEISNLSAFIYPNAKDMVVVEFTQNYSSNNLSDIMQKRQYWIKQDNIWKILYEGSAS